MHKSWQTAPDGPRVGLGQEHSATKYKEVCSKTGSIGSKYQWQKPGYFVESGA